MVGWQDVQQVMRNLGAGLFVRLGGADVKSLVNLDCVGIDYLKRQGFRQLQSQSALSCAGGSDKDDNLFGGYFWGVGLR